MSRTKDVEKQLKNLPIGEYKLTQIIKIIVGADELQKEGLFDRSPYGRTNYTTFVDEDNYYKLNITNEFKSLFPNGLEDIWVDLTYQRVLKLKQLIAHLKRKGMDGMSDLNFDKMLAGSIDIAVRPDGRGFVWDGFRRAIIALLNNKRFIKTSIEEHQDGKSTKDCQALEAFVFKIKNGFSENMAKEELYKSGIVYKETDAMKLYQVIKDMGVDVLGTNPNNPELGAFSEFQDTVLKKKLDSNEFLVQAAFKMKGAWPKDTNLTGYTLCGLAKFLDTLEKLDEDGESIVDFDIHTAHPNKKKKTCEVEYKLTEYAKTHKQVDLCANRLAGRAIESVAYNIGKKVMKLSIHQCYKLAEVLGFEEEDSDTLNFVQVVNK